MGARCKDVPGRIEFIRAKRAEGCLDSDIALMLNVGQSAISRFAKRHNLGPARSPKSCDLSADPVALRKALVAAYRYDESTGEFTARRNPSRKVGTLSPYGYLNMKVGNSTFRAHRLAWLYVHGEPPSGDLDHINRDRTDNRIANLREATRNQSAHNTGLRSTNTTGFKGVRHTKQGSYNAIICVSGRTLNLGVFDDPVAAAAAYDLAALRHHGQFACTNESLGLFKKRAA